MPNKILDAGFVTCFSGACKRYYQVHEVHANVIMQIHDVKICDAEPHGGKRLSGDL